MLYGKDTSRAGGESHTRKSVVAAAWWPRGEEESASGLRWRNWTLKTRVPLVRPWSNGIWAWPAGAICLLAPGWPSGFFPRLNFLFPSLNPPLFFLFLCRLLAFLPRWRFSSLFCLYLLYSFPGFVAVLAITETLRTAVRFTGCKWGKERERFVPWENRVMSPVGQEKMLQGCG